MMDWDSFLSHVNKFIEIFSNERVVRTTNQNCVFQHDIWAC